MTGLELRPLSLGEILDRTFTLYRRYFLLFLGISAIPQLLVLAFQLVQDEFPQTGALNLVMLAVLMIISLLPLRSGRNHSGGIGALFGAPHVDGEFSAPRLERSRISLRSGDAERTGDRRRLDFAGHPRHLCSLPLAGLRPGCADRTTRAARIALAQLRSHP